MRIGIGGMAHETNAFSNVPTTEALFRRLNYREGKELFTPGVRTFIGGYTDEAIAQSIELAPVFYANANPSGLIPRETLETMRDNKRSYHDAKLEYRNQKESLHNSKDQAQPKIK